MNESEYLSLKVALCKVYLFDFLSWSVEKRLRNVVVFLSHFGKKYNLHVGDRGSIPGRDRLKSLKQVVTATLSKVRQQV